MPLHSRPSLPSLAIWLLCVLAFGVNSSAEPEDLSDDLEKIIKETGQPALAALVIVNGEISAQGTAGVRKLGQESKVTIQDQWHIGSNTKSMTATLGAVLVEEGLISWDTTIGSVFGKEEWLHPDYSKVTLLQLLSNAGGCPTDVPPTLWKELFVSRDSPQKQRNKLGRGILSMNPAYPPGTKYVYSNAGFAIAGLMMERKTGTSWETLMKNKLFMPLGMNSAGFRAPDPEGSGTQPWGHAPQPVPPMPYGDNPHAIGPAGTVHCSILDWAKYARFHALGIPGPLLKKKETLDFLHQMHNPKGGYGLGWGFHKSVQLGETVLRHDGSNTMWYAIIWVAPEIKFAALVTSNSASTKAVSGCRKALDLLVQRGIKPIGKTKE